MGYSHCPHTISMPQENRTLLSSSNPRWRMNGIQEHNKRPRAKETSSGLLCVPSSCWRKEKKRKRGFQLRAAIISQLFILVWPKIHAPYTVFHWVFAIPLNTEHTYLHKKSLPLWGRQQELHLDESDKEQSLSHCTSQISMPSTVSCVSTIPVFLENTV